MRIAVYLDALTGGFETDLERARKTSEKAFKKIREDMESVAKTAVGTFAAGIAAATLVVKKNLEDINDLNIFSQKIGLPVEEVSELAYAADLLDINLQSLQGGFLALTRAQTTAAQGSEEMIALFDDLKIEFEDADGNLRNVSDVFDDLADKFAGMRGDSDKLALALKLLGGAGADLIPLLNKGSDGIAKFKEEARAAGLTISSETAHAAHEFTQNLERLSAQFGLAGYQLTEALLPGLNEFAEQILVLARDPAFQQDVANAIVTIGHAAVDTAEYIIDAANAIKFLYDEVRQFLGIVDDDDFERLDQQLADRRETIKAMKGEKIVMSEPDALHGFALPVTIQATPEQIAAAEKDAQEIQDKLDAISQRSEHRRQRDRARKVTSDFFKDSAELSKMLQTPFNFEDDKSRRKAEAEAEKAAKQLAKLRLEALSEEEKSVEELKQKYAELDKLLAQNAVSAEEAAKIREGLAAAKVEPLLESSLTDEEKAVRDLNKQYKELENLVNAGALSREKANKIAAGWATQWADAQRDQINGWRAAAGELSRYEQGLLALNKQFEEMQRDVDAKGPGAISQDMADRLKQGMQEKFEREHEFQFDDQMDAIEFNLDQLSVGDLGVLEDQLEERKKTLVDSFEDTQRTLEEMLREAGANEIDHRNRINEAILRNQQAHDDAMKKVEKDAQIEKLDILSDAFGGFASLMNTHNQKLFNIGKAFAIAQAVTSVASGAAKALELGWPLGPIAAAGIATEGAVRIAAILSTEYSGSYDVGGDIPKGKWGIVGERGPEIVHGPATVISRKETAMIMRDADSTMKQNEIQLRQLPANMITRKETAMVAREADSTMKQNEIELRQRNEINNKYIGMFDAGGFLPAGTWGIAGEKGRELISNSQVSSDSAPKFERMADREINIPPTKNVFVFDIDQLADALASSQAGERMVVHHVTRTGSKQRG